jgi:hypothetical protein
MNVETGQISENVELENLDEDETDSFKREWRERSTRAGISRHPHHSYNHHHHHQLPSNRLYHPSSSSHQPQLALEHNSSNGSSSSNRHHQKSSKHLNHPSQRTHFHHSDTIDLTNDSPIIQEVDELEQLRSTQALPTKRKASSSSSSTNGQDIQRKHRQNRF